jgi:hypothetical protein
MKQAISYLAPGATGKNPFTGKIYTNDTGNPVAVTKDYGSAVPGFIYVELITGEYLRVELGKGYLIGKRLVEGGGR